MSKTNAKAYPSPQHPDRPFSPSPARENRHSTSRPPSLLFGAPPVGTVATSSSMSFSGLPSSSLYSGISAPPSGLTRHSRAPSNDQNLTDIAYEPLPRRRHESEPAFGNNNPSGNTIAEGQFIGGGHRHRSDSVSTTSSASPPLGATSLLSAIAGPNTPQKQSDRDKHQYQDTEPGSPGSFRSLSEFSQNSSAGLGLPASRSFPRLHQPTVIRRPSGRGLAFVPSPAQTHVSPTISNSPLVAHHDSSRSVPAADDDPEERRSQQAAVRLAAIGRHLGMNRRQPSSGLDPDSSSSSLPVAGEEPTPMTPAEEASIRIDPNPYTPEHSSTGFTESPLAHPSPRRHSSAYTHLVNKAAESEVLNSMYPRLKEDLPFFDPPEEMNYSFDSNMDQSKDLLSSRLTPPDIEDTEGADTPAQEHIDDSDGVPTSQDLPRSRPTSFAKDTPINPDPRDDIGPYPVQSTSETPKAPPRTPVTPPLDMRSDNGYIPLREPQLFADIISGSTQSSPAQHPLEAGEVAPGTAVSTPLRHTHEADVAATRGEAEAKVDTEEQRRGQGSKEAVPASVRQATAEWIVPQEAHHENNGNGGNRDTRRAEAASSDLPSGSGDARASLADSRRALEPQAQSSAGKRGQIAQKGRASSTQVDETEQLHEVDEASVHTINREDAGKQAPTVAGQADSTKSGTHTHTRGPSTESDLLLNEVSIETGIDEPDSEAGRLVAPSSSSDVQPERETRVARYKARNGAQVYDIPTSSFVRTSSTVDTAQTQTQSQNANTDTDAGQPRSISLYAGLTRGSKPVPQLIAYRLELHLVWPLPAQQKLLTWVPGRRYVPDWDLKLVGGGKADDPFVVDVRGLARAIVCRIPVLGRLAAYM
ncbi:hypothetical protein I316_06006 [Kwoniella heveanensis BCC8398]|uniref:Uncharacterized protein n=1 Tax=Kwoniella heveanensis BCC8398 TaxID=1296120 RepID=A0A1B9GMT7_9TREE|nr:hypothetical protein I316_06006 [Kwoniella heveanensis BCC8398]